MTNTRRYLVSVIAILFLVGVSLVGVFVLGARPKLGLDLQGGLSVVLTARGDTDTEVLDQTVEIIRNRVDSIGAQEPDIARSGEENIIVQLPGIDDPDRALEIIGKTAQLRFREVVDSASLEDAQDAAREEGLRAGTDEFDEFVADEMEEIGWEVSEDDPVDQEVIFPGTEGDVWYRLGKAEVIGSDVADARANFDATTGGGWHVILDFTGEGSDKWAEVTTRLATTQGQLAIVLDEQVESAPVVQQAITNGESQITGQFSEPEAKDLALVLRTGALPIELEQSQVQRVSATLGTASLRAGLIAGAIGIAAVAIFMFLSYRLLALITLLGLAVFMALTFGVIGLISTYRGFSLTLAGVAGLIMSVGVAADTYIIYFERVKDEIREGKTFRSAVDRAFPSTLRTNLAANGVAAAAALILYVLAIGPVRGFALTLGISVVLDIFLLYFFTHPLVALISRRRKMNARRAMGVADTAVASVASR